MIRMEELDESAYSSKLKQRSLAKSSNKPPLPSGKKQAIQPVYNDLVPFDESGLSEKP